MVGIAAYAIDGYGDTASERGDEAIFSVVRQAMDEIGIERATVDGVVNTAQDAYDGITISSGLTMCPSGGYDKATTRIENGGVAALHQAVAKIGSGEYDCVVVAAEDTVVSDVQAVSAISQEPLQTRDVGINQLQAYAILTERLVTDRESVDQELLVNLAVARYQAASENPDAHRRAGHGRSEVRASGPVVGRLRELEIPPTSKGAVAIILVSDELAVDLPNPVVEVAGVGLGSSRYHYRDLDVALRQPALSAAVADAYDRAGIRDPSTEIDIVESFAPTPAFDILSVEALDLCPDRAGPDFLTGSRGDGSRRPCVNPSGGALATNPPNGGGLFRLVQAAKILETQFEGIDVGASETAVVTDSDLLLGDQGRTDAVAVLRGAA